MFCVIIADAVQAFKVILNSCEKKSNPLPYLHGGLTIVATDTLGQKEILSQYPKIGSLISSNNPVALAEALNNLLKSKIKLSQIKNNALNIFQEKLCWEHQEKVLIKQINISLA